MTPQYILRKSLCRTPHCFSAHEVGKGYTNRGDNPTTKADFDKQRNRRAESEIENLGFAPGYAEPSYTDSPKGILFANWNVFPGQITSILENYGFSVEWSDEWSTCGECGKAFRTSANSYGWEPSYVMPDDCSMVCRDCVDWADYIERQCLNNYDIAVPSNVDLIKLGFTRFNEDHFENGFHPGQNDKPKDVAKQLPSNLDYVFQINENSQFYTRFDVWVREKEQAYFGTQSAS